jgi:hypothetical protein
MVFSSLAVLQQFVKDYLVKSVEEGWITGAALGCVVSVCSAPAPLGLEKEHPWFSALPGDCQDPDETRLQEMLRGGGSTTPCLLLTTYASCRRVHVALTSSGEQVDFAVFDEAHNVHTPSRCFLWGGNGEKDNVCSGDAFLDVDNEEEAPGEDSGDDDQEEDTQDDNGEDDGEDDDEDEEDLANDPLEITPGGLEVLERHYPRRLYMTATPRAQMLQHPEVYGCRDDASRWDVYSYGDLLESQKDPLLFQEPCVKEFDIAVVLAGAPATGEGQGEDREFWDRVALLRKIIEGGRRGHTAVKRVLLFHAYAMDAVRGARTFADPAFWERPLSWVLSHSPSLMKGDERSWDFEKDFVVYSVVGGEGNVMEAVERFNGPDEKIHILCSCQTLREGVTLRSCDLVCYADGKRSRRDIIQSALRGIKYDAERPDARLRILLLVALDGGDLSRRGLSDSPEASSVIARCLQQSNKMERLATVLAALQSQDHVLAEELEELALNFLKSSAHVSTAETEQERGRCGVDNEAGGGSDRLEANNEETLAVVSPAHVRRRVAFNLAPELMWGFQSGEIERAMLNAAGSVADIAIRMIRTSGRSRQELVSEKFDWFCRLWPDQEMPCQGEKKSIPSEWLPADALCAAPLDGGSFWSSIQKNFVGDGSGPGTTLNEVERARAGALPWFSGALERLLAIRGKRALFYQPTVSEKLNWFCCLWPGLETPCHREKTSIPSEWLPADSLGAAPFDGRCFWGSIQKNFVADGSGSGGTTLDEASRARVRALPWFSAVLERLVALRGKRALFYQPTVSEKIDWLCRLWPDPEEPRRGDNKSIPANWLPADAQGAAPFDGGGFWNSIQKNFVADGRGANASLNDAERARVCALPWFSGAIERLVAIRGKRTILYQPTVSEKLDWLCRLWPDPEEPRRGDKKSIPAEWLPADAQGAAPFDGGGFWNSIQKNFVGDGSGANASLNEVDRARVRAVPWFSGALERLVAIRGKRALFCQPTVSEKLDWFCRLWPDLEEPRWGEKKSIPSEWLPTDALGAAPMDGGSFWGSIQKNFAGSGRGTRASLNEAECARVRALPWFAGSIERLVALRGKRAKSYQAAVSEKLDWFCRLWPGLEMPCHGEKKSIPSEWLPADALGAAPMDGGSFWSSIQKNFVVGGSGSHATLNEVERIRVCALPWFSGALERLVAIRGKRALFYQPTVSEKLEWLCRLWPGLETPSQREKKSIPSNWLPADALGAAPFDGGSFWSHIQNNFVGDGSGAHSILNDVDRAKVQALPWSAPVLQRLKETRARKLAVYQAKTSEKAEWLCRLWPGLETPRQGEKKSIPSEWLPADALGAALFDGGVFWNSIRRNFVADGSGANIKLNEDERARMRGLPWVTGAIQRLDAFQENRTARTTTPTASPTSPPASPSSASPTSTVCMGSTTGEEEREAPGVDESAEKESASLGAPPQKKRCRAPKKKVEFAPEAQLLKDHDLPEALLLEGNMIAKKRPRAGGGDEVRGEAEATHPKSSKKMNSTIPSCTCTMKVARIAEACEKRSASEVYSLGGYNASNFEDLHHEFKNAMNSEFINLATNPCAAFLSSSSSYSSSRSRRGQQEEVLSAANAKVLYLDDWATARDSGNLRTTEALLAAGFTAPHLYCANPDVSVVERLSCYGVNAQCSTIAEAFDGQRKWGASISGGGSLQEYEPGDILFDAIYADFCYGSSENIIYDLRLLLPKAKRLLAYTMTRRGQGSMVKRVGEIKDFLLENGFDLARETHSASEHEFAQAGVFTSFFVRVSAQLPFTGIHF